MQRVAKLQYPLHLAIDFDPRFSRGCVDPTHEAVGSKTGILRLERVHPGSRGALEVRRLRITAWRGILHLAKCAERWERQLAQRHVGIRSVRSGRRRAMRL